MSPAEARPGSGRRTGEFCLHTHSALLSIFDIVSVLLVAFKAHAPLFGIRTKLEQHFFGGLNLLGVECV